MRAWVGRGLLARPPLSPDAGRLLLRPHPRGSGEGVGWVGGYSDGGQTHPLLLAEKEMPLLLSTKNSPGIATGSPLGRVSSGFSIILRSLQ